MEEYEELVELGFEGVDKIVDKYHDQVYQRLPNPPWRRGNKPGQPQQPQPQQQQSTSDREQSQQENQGARPRQQRPEPRKRRSSWPDDRYDSAGEGDDDMSSAYGSRGRDGGYYQEEETYYSRGRPEARESADYGRKDTAVAGGRGAYYVPVPTYPAAPSPPQPYQRPQYYTNQAYAYNGGYDQDNASQRERPQARRRPSSYSPPRPPRDYSSERRPRSKSPKEKEKDHHITATLIGALAGGVLGRNIKDGKESVWTTLGGAVAGGIVARKGEEWWDERQEKESRKGERRRREREYRN